MIKIALVFVLILSVLTPFSISTAEAATKTYSATVNIKSGTSIVREKPSASSKKVGSLKKGMKVTVYVKKVNTWSEIRYKKKKAYVMTKYLKFSSSKSDISLSTYEVIWIGDSTTDKNLNYTYTNSPTYVLHEEFENKFLKPGRPLYGAKSTVFAKSGATTQQFIDDTVNGTNPTFAGITDVINYSNKKARKNQIIVYSLGHNDGINLDNWETNVYPKHKQLIEKLLKETNAYIILRMPNAWASAERGPGYWGAIHKTESLYKLYVKLGQTYKNRTLMVNIQDILNWKTGAWTDRVWSGNTAYTVGQYVNSNGLVYRCIQSGTSSNSITLAGTGSSITDGTAIWTYEFPMAVYNGDWTHPNALGYRAIANVIGEAIEGTIFPKD